MNGARRNLCAKTSSDVSASFIYRPTKVVRRDGLKYRRRRVLLARNGRIGEVPVTWAAEEFRKASMLRLASPRSDAR